MRLTVEDLLSLVARGELMITNAARASGEPRCAWDSSGLTLSSPTCAEVSNPLLLIDIGGTHTKVAMARNDNFKLLFDHPNEFFRGETASSEAALLTFVRTLFRLISEVAPELTDSSIPVRIGVIWSNQISTAPLASSHLVGTSGLVKGFNSGGYGKGEWFLTGLHDGYDIGADFVSAILNSKITSNLFIISNDTIFTLFAHPGSHAGVVVSSGANCTLVGDDDHTIYNSELGGMLTISASLLTEGDRLFAQKKGSTELVIEELCAGAWMRDLCLSHIESLTSVERDSPLAQISTAIKGGALSYSNATLSKLLREDPAIPSECIDLSQAARTALSELVGALMYRAGAFAAVLTYLSVSNQIRQGNLAPVISLDSSMARHFPGFYLSVKQHLHCLMPGGATHSLNLIEPVKLDSHADIPVPMIGLARALRSFRVRTDTKR